MCPTGVIGLKIECSSNPNEGPGYDGEISEFCISYEVPRGMQKICVPVYGKNYYKPGWRPTKNDRNAEFPPPPYVVNRSRGDNNSDVADRLLKRMRTMIKKGDIPWTDLQGAMVQVRDVPGTKRGQPAGGGRGGAAVLGKLEKKTDYYVRVVLPNVSNVDGAVFGDQTGKFEIRGYGPPGGNFVGVLPTIPWKKPTPFDRTPVPWGGPKGRRPKAKDCRQADDIGDDVDTFDGVVLDDTGWVNQDDLFPAQ